MSEFFFVVKTALFSILLLMVLQMRVGNSTLERHSEHWIYQSRVGAEMQTVARGAVRAGQEGWAWIKFQIQDQTGSSQERSSRRRSQSDDLD